MKKLLLLFVLFSLFLFSQSNLDAQIGDLCQQISQEMSGYSKPTVAVIEFSDLEGNITDLGKFLSEELITKLYQTKKFKVIERQMLNKIIKEQKLQVSGIIDEVSAKKLGKLLGVNAIVSGTVTDLANSVKINARLIGTETGEIFGAASTEITKDESIEKLLRVQSSEVSDGGTELTSSPGKKKTKKTDVKGFQFEFVQCKRLPSNNIICEVLITNNNQSQDFSIYTKNRTDMVTRLYDTKGNEYWNSLIKWGNRESKDEIRNMLIAGVPTKAVFTFEDVPTNINNFSALDIAVWTTTPWRVQLKDISIAK